MNNLSPQVYIIGAGPGDPDLLTIKARKILDQCDVILYADSLVPDQILAGIGDDTEIIKTGDKTLEEIITIIGDRVSRNLTVVRLHSGDLTIYSTVNEQVRALKAANIRVELVPGIGVYQAAAAQLQVELTVPEVVQSIILTRPSGRASSVPVLEDLASLAQHQASLCLYLAARHVKSSQDKLLLHYPGDTPVAICFRIGWPDQQIIVVPLEKMAKVTEEQQLTRTTLYIISPALRNEYATRSRLYDPANNHLFRPIID